MKIFLDDERTPQQVYGEGTTGWTCCRWPEDVIALLQQHEGKIESISLDHDLGEGIEYSKPRTGYDVLLWLEEAVLTRGYKPPRILLHTQNAAARPKMAAAARQIRGYKEKHD